MNSPSISRFLTTTNIRFSYGFVFRRQHQLKTARKLCRMVTASDSSPPAERAHAMVSDGVNSGQRHERLDAAGGAALTEENGRLAEVDITIGQKMLSAISGSFFTSLLGGIYKRRVFQSTNKIAVTPLDVVRVRLQSQQQDHQPQRAPSTLNELRSTPSTPLPRSYPHVPSNLGVTACCREVFWTTNNVTYCVVGDGALAPASGLSNSVASIGCAAEEAQRKTFNSTFEGLRKIAQNEGVTALWRGLSPTLLMAVPGNVIYFAGYDWLRTSDMSPIKARISETYSPLIAGSSARVIAAFFVSPIELFRTRMQATQGQSASETLRETATGVKEMVQSQGPRSLWRGLTLTLWRDVPFSAFYWWGYEAIRNFIGDERDRRSGLSVNSQTGLTGDRSHARRRQDHTTTFLDSFASGAVSGGIASIVTTPFDVGKTRQQVFRQSGNSKMASAVGDSAYTLKSEYTSMPRLLSHIYQEEGVRGLFKGWVPRTLKVAPACAIMISTYELGKKMAQSVQDRKER